jgi:hypothetical protein
MRDPDSGDLSELEAALAIFRKHGIEVTIDESLEWDVIFVGPSGAAYLDRFLNKCESQCGNDKRPRQVEPRPHD